MKLEFGCDPEKDGLPLLPDLFYKVVAKVEGELRSAVMLSVKYEIGVETFPPRKNHLLFCFSSLKFAEYYMKDNFRNCILDMRIFSCYAGRIYYPEYCPNGFFREEELLQYFDDIRKYKSMGWSPRFIHFPGAVLTNRIKLAEEIK